MKYAVIIPDGMADYPVEKLGGRTPLEAAATPNMDRLASEGEVGLVRNVPVGMSPGSDVAIMSVLGFDPRVYHTGRAPLEAPAIGVELSRGQVAFRMNLVTVADGLMADYSGGHIETKEAAVLVQTLEETLGGGFFHFHAGVSYRHLAVTNRMDLLDLVTTPPHDISGKEVSDYLPRGVGAEEVIALMAEAGRLLEQHEINSVRRDLGENPANAVWFWGQGTRPEIPAFSVEYGKRAAVISAVALLQSLAIYAGMDVLDVEGMTGYYDTNYAGKGECAVRALNEEGYDVVVVHVEAPDEAGHNGDVEQKVKAIEAVDREVLGRLLQECGGSDMSVYLLADHPTPISVKSHTSEPSPYLMWGAGTEHTGAEAFGESACRASGRLMEEGWKMMKRFLAY
ncbi:MAG: cofactor-independent phosphoglycerate mutase [Planctomycetes bacterium]|nr:cofactor-independent phosphoglycerate mutase [Planctomycetota bacterium]